MNTRRLVQLAGSLVAVWMMGVWPVAQAAQEDGVRVHPPAVPATGRVTPAEIMAAITVALEEANVEQAKRDHAELERTFTRVRARIAALPSRTCGLSVPWNEYTSRFAAILARVDDGADPLQTAERGHASAGLNELDRFITSAMTYEADVCADNQELSTLEQEGRRYRADAQSRLDRVAAAVCTTPTADRAALAALVDRHRPANEQVQAVYDEAAVGLLDEIGRLGRGGTLCKTTGMRSLVKKLPGIVVENYAPYRDPVGVKTIENDGIRELLQRKLDERGKNWLETFTVPPANVVAGTAEVQEEASSSRGAGLLGTIVAVADSVVATHSGRPAADFERLARAAEADFARAVDPSLKSSDRAGAAADAARGYAGAVEALPSERDAGLIEEVRRHAADAEGHYRNAASGVEADQSGRALGRTLAFAIRAARAARQVALTAGAVD